MSRARRSIAVVAVAVIMLVLVVARGRLTASSSARATAATNGASPSLTAQTQHAPVVAPPPPVVGGQSSPAATPTKSECDQACGIGVECRFDDHGVACPKQCLSSNDCSPTELCEVFVDQDDHDRFVKRCVGSNCGGFGDKDNCGAHATCVFTGRLEGGVFRCEPAGTRTKGRTCVAATDSTGGVCAKGLTCADGVCVPAICDSDAECPQGTYCRGIAAGTYKGCVPGCTADEDCPSGQRCATTRWGPRCLDRTSPAVCLETGCPEGSACVVEFVSPLRASCHKACTDSNDSGCAKNEFCGVLGDKHYCIRHCRTTADCPNENSCIDFPDGTMGCGVDAELLTRDYLARDVSN